MWRHQRSTRCLSPPHTCTTQSPPPSGSSWLPWTPAGPGRQQYWLYPRLDWPHPSEPSWCRTLSCAPDTSTLCSWHTGAHNGTGIWWTGPPARPAHQQWSHGRGALLERAQLHRSHFHSHIFIGADDLEIRIQTLQDFTLCVRCFNFIILFAQNWRNPNWNPSVVENGHRASSRTFGNFGNIL